MWHRALLLDQSRFLTPLVHVVLCRIRDRILLLLLLLLLLSLFSAHMRRSSRGVGIYLLCHMEPWVGGLWLYWLTSCTRLLLVVQRAGMPGRLWSWLPSCSYRSHVLPSTGLRHRTLIGVSAYGNLGGLVSCCARDGASRHICPLFGTLGLGRQMGKLMI